MPRIPRVMVTGECYHVISRANERSTLFHQPVEYDAFVELIGHAQGRVTLPLLAACVMPNHFHLVVRVPGPAELGSWLHWLLTTHAHRYNAYRERAGHVWQGRYKAFPIQHDVHLLTVMRYVERNASRAGLVQRAEAWPWGSLAWRTERSPGPGLADAPLQLPASWVDWVNRPHSPAELAALRLSVNRQRPFGSENWAQETSERLGLDHTMRPLGRPSGKSAEPVPFSLKGD